MVLTVMLQHSRGLDMLQKKNITHHLPQIQAQETSGDYLSIAALQLQKQSKVNRLIHIKEILTAVQQRRLFFHAQIRASPEQKENQNRKPESNIRAGKGAYQCGSVYHISKVLIHLQGVKPADLPICNCIAQKRPGRRTWSRQLLYSDVSHLRHKW